MDMLVSELAEVKLQLAEKRYDNADTEAARDASRSSAQLMEEMKEERSRAELILADSKQEIIDMRALVQTKVSCWGA